MRSGNRRLALIRRGYSGIGPEMTRVLPETGTTMIVPAHQGIPARHESSMLVGGAFRSDRPLSFLVNTSEGHNSTAMRRWPYRPYLAARICFYETLRSPHGFFMCSAICWLQAAHGGSSQSQNGGI